MKHTLIIAEAGVNHNGSIEIAKKLVDVAADAGVDYIKFQTFNTEKLVSKSAPMAFYQKKNIGTGDDSQFDMLKNLELTQEEHRELIDYCHQKGVKFLSTAFDMGSIEQLASYHLGLWKIPSGEITDYPYIKRIAQFGERVILSTGMSTMKDIGDAIRVLLKWGVTREEIVILHCNTEYPTPYQDVNLKAMDTIRTHFGVEVGYSDHTKGIEVPIAAVAMGASIIEKHFTLDRNMEGPDHRASLEPEELKTMVSAIRNIELAIGDGEKTVTDSERGNVVVARKSIFAATSIHQGETFTENNLLVKRPGAGISPMRWEEVIGQKARRDFAEDELIEL